MWLPGDQLVMITGVDRRRLPLLHAQAGIGARRIVIARPVAPVAVEPAGLKINAVARRELLFDRGDEARGFAIVVRALSSLGNELRIERVTQAAQRAEHRAGLAPIAAAAVLGE